MKRFRYPGVRPFEAADRALFFGRDRDIADLYELVRAEPLVVLFGKSGYGKSSLLNAGVLPLFAETSDENEDWFVLETRFGEYTEGLSDTPLERLRQRLLEKIPTPATQTLTPQTLPNSLWLDFKQRLSPQNRRFLLVFDQFEEFFSYPPEQQAAFKDQLADLLYEEMPQAIRAAARSLERDERRALAARMEVKALFAIRSDRMSDLDRLKDRLPAILHKRYELRALTREQAREAIVQPALLAGEAFNTPSFEYQEDALQKILDELSRSNAGADKSGGIESFQLQILCDDIDSRVANGLVPDRDGNPDFVGTVSVEDLPDFSEVFARYYERRLAHLPENQRDVARRVIEDGLVRYDAARDEGRRLSVDGQALLKDFEAAGLTPALLRELENTFLVRREPNTLGGHNYELSHDTLLAPVISAKKKRLEAEERERLRLERERLASARRRNAVASLAALLLLGFALWQTYAAQQATADADKAYQAAAEQERRAEAATRYADAQGEEAENARRMAELEKRNALSEQEKAELEKRKAIEAAQRAQTAGEEAENARHIAELEKKNALTEQKKAERLLAASRYIAARKLPENFDILISLESLNCSSWFIDSLSPEVGKLKNLKSLDLGYNRLKGLPKEIWELQNLQFLDLHGNQLKSLLGEIRNLKNLQSLDLRDNISIRLPEEIWELQNLKSLNLNGLKFQNLQEKIGKLQNLQSLDLAYNRLNSLPKEIGKLQNLQSLDLAYNGLKSLPREICELQNLQLLDLSGNQLTNLPEEIWKLQNLQSLDLSRNQLASLPVEALKQLKNLKKLDLSRNPLLLPASEVEALRQAMPWCEVVWEE